MDWPTIIGATIVGAIFVLIVVREIINKKKGKRSCSSCGSCSACSACSECGVNCHEDTNKDENK